MERYPALNIYFPPSRENELHENMRRRAASPWSASESDAFGRAAEDGCFYFHRDTVDDQPSATVCIHREKEGHWVVQNIVPDEGQISIIPIDVYKAILTEFDSMVAEPAAECMEGMTVNEFSQYRLQDYFSPQAVELLKAFCARANQGDLGSHPLDQERWINFLLAVFDEGKDVHCDIFGYCLKTAKWWSEGGIRELVHEYDFAMRLLKQSGRRASPN